MNKTGVISSDGMVIWLNIIGHMEKGKYIKRVKYLSGSKKVNRLKVRNKLKSDNLWINKNY